MKKGKQTQYKRSQNRSYGTFLFLLSAVLCVLFVFGLSVGLWAVLELKLE